MEEKKKTTQAQRRVSNNHLPSLLFTKQPGSSRDGPEPQFLQNQG